MGTELAESVLKAKVPEIASEFKVICVCNIQ